MSDEMIGYYNRELLHVRRAAAGFAAAHPKIAGRLRMSADSIEDPHVGRMVEAFAFLTARIRQKLEDDFPELSDSLLSILYPHYVAPVPSMAVVQFEPQPDLEGRYALKRGTELLSEAVDGEPCRFTTTQAVELWPARVAGAALGGRPLAAPPNPRAAAAAATLRLSLDTAVDGGFAALAPPSLRFFLRGQPQQVHPLYEAILNDTIGVALAEGPNDPNPVLCGPECLRPVGFGADEGMLPYSSRSFLGYRLLTEYFAFPEKFLFFDLAPPGGCRAKGDGGRLEVFLYLRRPLPDLERGVSAENFALGCAPVVNLFRKRAEPIALDHFTDEYKVVPDARRPQAQEVYAVERVRATNADGVSRLFTPFYSVSHAADRDDDDGTAFWLAARRPSEEGLAGTDVFLSLADLGLEPRHPTGWVLSVDTLCLNRDLPERLPFGGGHPHLTPSEGAPLVKAVHCLTPPTPTLRPSLGQGGRWRLLSHLSLNHLSLADSAEGATALREILSLYDWRDSAETRSVIQGIMGINCTESVARMPGGRMGSFCRGLDVRLELDESRFAGAGLFLTASVLERFLGLYCHINSFTRLTALVKGRTGVLRQWPPRAGDLTLL